MNKHGTVRVAILDLYQGVANEGMRCIREILNQFADINHLDIEVDEFDVRQKIEVPSVHYDIFISTGGPGSPIDSKGSEWENAYFGWLNAVKAYNEDPQNDIKKQVFLICHSYQLVMREWNLGVVSKRKSTSFGVFPIHQLEKGREDIIFKGLPDPFYAVDSRDFQVTQPNLQAINENGGYILAIEKDRPHVPLERAIMAMRINNWLVGTQFHPEADAPGMAMYLQTPEKKASVVANYGQAKWDSMIEQLNDPDKIMFTYAHVLPNFLSHAIGKTELLLY